VPNEGWWVVIDGLGSEGTLAAKLDRSHPGAAALLSQGMAETTSWSCAGAPPA
jgi:hypothetical protein